MRREDDAESLEVARVVDAAVNHQRIGVDGVGWQVGTKRYLQVNRLAKVAAIA